MVKGLREPSQFRVRVTLYFIIRAIKITDKASKFISSNFSSSIITPK